MSSEGQGANMGGMIQNKGMMQGGGMNQNDELQPGQTGDNTKFLLASLRSLHQFIQTSTDPNNIRLARLAIGILTKLISGDQLSSIKSNTLGQAMPTP